MCVLKLPVMKLEKNIAALSNIPRSILFRMNLNTQCIKSKVVNQYASCGELEMLLDLKVKVGYFGELT